MRFLAWLGDGKRGNVVLATAIIIGVFLLFPIPLRYEPYEVYETTVVPDRVCPGQGVKVIVDREVYLPRPWYGLWSFQVSSQWEDVDTGATYPAYSGPAKTEDIVTGRARVESDLIREAPPAPGVYVLKTEYTLKGRVLYLPQTYYSPEYESDALKVISSEAATCRDDGTTVSVEEQESSIEIEKGTE